MKKKKNGPEEKVFKKPNKIPVKKKKDDVETKSSRIVNKYIKIT